MKIQEPMKYPLEAVKKTVNKWLYLENDEIVDVILGAYLANQLKTDPLWLVIIAPPSSAKTELLRAFDGNKGTCFLSSLTPSTLVSGFRNPEGNNDPSLLLKLHSKVLILKDFTSVLSMRSESQKEILSQLREIYDGKYNKAFGTGTEFNWQGHVGLIAACTPVYDKHYGVINALGDRFILYRSTNENPQMMGARAQQIVGQEEKMRIEIQTAFHDFVSQFQNIENIQFEQDETINDKIVALACFCASARCAVERNYSNQTIQYMPAPEGTPRLVKQFTQVGMGIALAQGKNILDEAVYNIIKKIGQDIMTAQRKLVLEHLWQEEVFEENNQWRTTAEIAHTTKLPKSTVKIILEDLNIVGLLNQDFIDDIDKATPYKWQFSGTAYGYALDSAIFAI